MQKEVRFWQIPVGQEFIWGNGRYKKIKEVGPDDICQDEMKPNSWDYQLDCPCIMSAIFKCLIEEDA